MTFIRKSNFFIVISYVSTSLTGDWKSHLSRNRITQVILLLASLHPHCHHCQPRNQKYPLSEIMNHWQTLDSRSLFIHSSCTCHTSKLSSILTWTPYTDLSDKLRPPTQISVTIYGPLHRSQ